MNQTLSNKQRKKQELRTEANAIISLLAERFPDCFTLHAAKRRPLKINIGADILAALNGAIPRQELGRALSFYTGNAIYLSRMHPGTARIDLAGNKAGEVTAEHAAQAKERLTARTSRARKAPKPKPPTPKRITLTDLRAAGARRRAIGVAS